MRALIVNLTIILIYGCSSQPKETVHQKGEIPPNEICEHIVDTNEPKIIRLTKDGKCLINGHQIEIENLSEQLGPNDYGIINPDDDIPQDVINRVLDEFEEALNSRIQE